MVLSSEVLGTEMGSDSLTTNSSLRSHWWILQELRRSLRSLHNTPFQALGTQRSARSGPSVLPRPWGGGVGRVHVPTLQTHGWGSRPLRTWLFPTIKCCSQEANIPFNVIQALRAGADPTPHC